MKTIYFVRHGESESNAGFKYSGPNVSITEKGKQQAAFMAERVSTLPIDAFISSTLPRARQTADIISKKILLPIEYSDLFVEMRRPSEQQGQMRNEGEGLRIEMERMKNAEIRGWHYSDEENFEDLQERARKGLDLLAAKQEKNILVITHGLFLRHLMSVAVFGTDLSARITSHIVRAFRTENTGLTIFKYDEEAENPWSVWIWNDHAHLGEVK